MIQQIEENAKILLKHGAKPNVQDKDGNTPMHHAVLAKNIAMVRLLDDYDADARIKNNAQMSAIDLTTIESIKDVKIHFMSQQKYSRESFSV